MSSLVPIVSPRRRLRERFEAIDWSFPCSSTRGSSDDIHPYPAKFIPEIPAAALSLAPADGTVVDPFCGVGTTLTTSMRQGRRTVGIDLNPIATTVARAKTSDWTSGDAALLDYHRGGLVAAARHPNALDVRRAAVRIPRLDHWFTEEAQRTLAGAAAYVAAIPRSDPWHWRTAAALSSIVVRASRQESDTRYAAISKADSGDSVATWLDRALRRVAAASRELAAESPPGAEAEVHTDEAAHLDAYLGEGEVGAAIFSPPYPNAYEYWLYHKYRMYWLGFDPNAVRAKEIGARPHYSGTGKLTEEDFARQMSEVMLALRGVLHRDGIVVVVVGDSRIRGRMVDNGHVMQQVARDCDYDLVSTVQRSLRRTRRSFNLAVARASAEHVLLLTPR